MQRELQLADSEIEAQHNATLFEDVDAMHRIAPSLFATMPHPKMSQRYAFTNTYDILLHVHNRGFKVTSVQGGNKRYNKMLIRMRSSVYDERDYAPELIIGDSHDGSSRIHMLLGFIRYICMNGCVAGDILYAKSFLHVAQDLMAQIMLELEDIAPHINKLKERITVFQRHETSTADRIILADTAVRHRFGEERSGSFVIDMRRKMLERRREPDTENDLYTVLNVVQENVLRGGMHYVSNNTLRRMTAIRDVGRNLSINKTLWSCAEDIVARKVLQRIGAIPADC